MCFSYATKYASSGLNYTIDYGNSSRRSCVSTQLLWLGTKSFFSFTATYHQIRQASERLYSLEVATQASRNPKLWLMTDVLENRCLTTCFSLTLTSTNSPSITIDIESCGIFITSFWPHCLKDPLTQLPLHNWHNWKLLVNRKKLHLNSATASYCNSNRVSIMHLHYDLLHRENLKLLCIL